MKTNICAGMLMISVTAMAVDYPVVDTGQVRCYDDQQEVVYPKVGQPFFGQDAQYNGNQFAYRKNGDGTVTDLVTGLMWQADPGEKKTYDEAVAGATKCRLGGHDDWRLPTIQELYSLIDFSGTDVDPMGSIGSTPFIDAGIFKFQYGKEEDGDRIIDSQWATSTLYVGKVMHGQQAMFGVNFADGRIKGYPTGNMPGRGAKTFYVIYVRGNEKYGKNDFVDNGDDTITDRATGLIWMKADSGKGMDWVSALEYAENMSFAGHNDWRLPNAKELQSIVDYSRSPDTSQSAAIDPFFECSPIMNEAGQRDFGHYWSSTTHTDSRGGSRAVYLAFGRALGNMHNEWMDVHGAGAQRSDQKSGDESQLSVGHGPQGDAQRINNYVRLVCGGAADPSNKGPEVESQNTSRGHPGFVSRLDRDHDGKVSRSEFDGPPDQFDVLDKNHDGFLSESEAPPLPGQRSF
ncbi:MAG: DUF1566 domain-containing protein [Pontiellaceae bacterium]|nr:DUF1566 domain-containing protein [Pontiellaceae bacterium]MBN2785117.1 DUF1566 domain-containing protein [Pontiellaceae bacterium]